MTGRHRRMRRQGRARELAPGAARTGHRGQPREAARPAGGLAAGAARPPVERHARGSRTMPANHHARAHAPHVRAHTPSQRSHAHLRHGTRRTPSRARAHGSHTGTHTITRARLMCTRTHGSRTHAVQHHARTRTPTHTPTSAPTGSGYSGRNHQRPVQRSPLNEHQTEPSSQPAPDEDQASRRAVTTPSVLPIGVKHHPPTQPRPAASEE